MEGNEARVVIFDSGVTGRLGFTNDRGRCLVNMARGTDASVIIGQPSTLESPHHGDGEIEATFKMAADLGVVRYMQTTKSMLRLMLLLHSSLTVSTHLPTLQSHRRTVLLPSSSLSPAGFMTTLSALLLLRHKQSRVRQLLTSNTPRLAWHLGGLHGLLPGL